MRDHRTEPVVRIVTDEGVDGYGEAEEAQAIPEATFLFYRLGTAGEDPTDVARVMLKIRPWAASRPWGSAVGAIEMALWDIAGRSSDAHPELLGGKVRDKCGATTAAFASRCMDLREDYAENMQKMKDSEHFGFIKQGVAFHSRMIADIPDMTYSETRSGLPMPGTRAPHGRTQAHRRVCRGYEGCAGRRGRPCARLRPGPIVPDAIRLAKALD